MGAGGRTEPWGVTGPCALGPGSALSGFKRRCSERKHFLRRHCCVRPSLTLRLPLQFQNKVSLKLVVSPKMRPRSARAALSYVGEQEGDSVGDFLSLLLFGGSEAREKLYSRSGRQASPSRVVPGPGPGAASSLETGIRCQKHLWPCPIWRHPQLSENYCLPPCRSYWF